MNGGGQYQRTSKVMEVSSAIGLGFAPCVERVVEGVNGGRLVTWSGFGHLGTAYAGDWLPVCTSLPANFVFVLDDGRRFESTLLRFQCLFLFSLTSYTVLLFFLSLFTPRSTFSSSFDHDSADHLWPATSSMPFRKAECAGVPRTESTTTVRQVE